MKDLTGYMSINGKDTWTEYSAFLCEDKQDDNFNFGELLKPLEMKDYTAVDFRERDGEELPDVLPSPCYKARDVTLYIAVYASTLAEYNPPCRTHGSDPCGLGESEGERITCNISLLLQDGYGCESICGYHGRQDRGALEDEIQGTETGTHHRVTQSLTEF